MDTIVLTTILSVAANADGRAYLYPDSSTEQWEVEEISVVANDTSAANGTNYVSIQCFKGASTALTAARTTASSGYTQGSGEAMTVTAAGADKILSQTSPFHIRCTKAGTGVAINLAVTVRVRRLRV
jgi:hypothetical protein